MYRYKRNNGKVFRDCIKNGVNWKYLPNVWNISWNMKFGAWIKIHFWAQHRRLDATIFLSVLSKKVREKNQFKFLDLAYFNNNVFVYIYLNNHQWQLYWSATTFLLKISHRQTSMASANGKNTTYIDIIK